MSAISAGDNGMSVRHFNTFKMCRGYVIHLQWNFRLETQFKIKCNALLNAKMNNLRVAIWIL